MRFRGSKVLGEYVYMSFRTYASKVGWAKRSVPNIQLGSNRSGEYKRNQPGIMKWQ